MSKNTLKKITALILFNYGIVFSMENSSQLTEQTQLTKKTFCEKMKSCCNMKMFQKKNINRKNLQYFSLTEQQEKSIELVTLEQQSFMDLESKDNNELEQKENVYNGILLLNNLESFFKNYKQNKKITKSEFIINYINELLDCINEMKNKNFDNNIKIKINDDILNIILQQSSDKDIIITINKDMLNNISQDLEDNN